MNSRKRLAVVVGVAWLAAALMTVLFWLRVRQGAGDPALAWVLASEPLSLVAMAGLVYWGFAPVVRERRRIEGVIARSGVELLARRGTGRRETPVRSHGGDLRDWHSVPVTLYPNCPSGADTRFSTVGWWRTHWSWDPEAGGERLSQAAFYVFFFFLFPGSNLLGLAGGRWLLVVVALSLLMMFPHWQWRRLVAQPAGPTGTVRQAFEAGDFGLAIDRAERLDSMRPYNQRGDAVWQALAHYRWREFVEAEEAVRRALVFQADSRRVAPLLLRWLGCGSSRRGSRKPGRRWMERLNWLRLISMSNACERFGICGRG